MALVEDRWDGGTHLLTRMPPAKTTRLEALRGLQEIVEEDAARFMDDDIELWGIKWNRAHKDDALQQLEMAEDGTLQRSIEVGEEQRKQEEEQRKKEEEQRKEEEERTRREVFRELAIDADDGEELSDVPPLSSDDEKDDETEKAPASTRQLRKRKRQKV